ncbi:myosin-9-like isoform X2 [Neocloeon triangulifer]|uniref:myosin-9-like isoform X2 n=1 Tax=Neocloeon triangulifer TaxID=2078957 RepID=UPI00286EC4E5|nr:myosin-9-like isoform X2 [Neocloeon triangulifer]
MSSDRQESEQGSVTSEFRRMIDDEVRQIEQHSGHQAEQLKSSLYEKWVSELLDTIAIMSKHTLELEKVATASVSKLEDKLLESTETTHNFMQQNHNRFTSTKLHADSGIGNSVSNQQTEDLGTGIREPLIKRLQESSDFAKTYLLRCNELEKKIEILEASNQGLRHKLLEKEEAVRPNLSENLEKSRLQSELDARVRDLAQETSLRKRLEKRVCKQSEEIKALTQEVAAKHDQVLQQEQRTREVQQQMEKMHAQNNYQNLLIESLRKEVKKLKLATNSKNSSYATPSILSARECDEVGNKGGEPMKIVVEHQELLRLQRRLEEMETKVKENEELIMTLQAAAGPSRSQTLALIHKMSSDQLKLTLFNKEKEILEQRTLIGQLQEALVSSKNKLDDLHKSGDHADSLCPREYFHCGHHHHHVHTERPLSKGLLKEMKFSLDLTNELSSQLSEARRQLRFYEQHNRDLSLEVMRVRNDKTESELQLEKIVKEKGADLAAKEAQIQSLQAQVGSQVDHSTCAQQIATLQHCVEEGAKMLREKNEQIAELRTKLDEMCEEAEEQLRVVSRRDAALAKLQGSLRNVCRDREELQMQIESLKDEGRQEASFPNEEYKEQIKRAEDELSLWKERYKIISTNLEQKEKMIEEMRRRHEVETSQAMAQTVSVEKMVKIEAEVEDLKDKLATAKTELSEMRARCEMKVAEVEKCRRRLDLEAEKGRRDKDEAQKFAVQIEEQTKKVQELKKDMDYQQNSFKSREDEMKRLLRLSCENVQHLQELNVELNVKAEAAERLEQRVLQLEAATKEAQLALEVAQEEVERLHRHLEVAEREANEGKEQLGRFETELMLSTERVVQLQGLLAQAQQERQRAADDAANLRAQLGAQALANQAQQAELTTQLQSAQLEKQHLERSQKQLEDMCKTLSSQLGGQKSEREKYVRGLKQAAAERSQMCQEARQVLAVAREWLAEHRASAMELHQLRTERERLLKENNALRHRSRASTSMLNPWDCGLVDREESGFWSSHWTTQLDEVDQEIETFRRRTESWGEEEEDEVDGAEGRGDNGYQSGYQSGSSK